MSLAASILFVSLTVSAPTVGKVPPTVTLKGDLGGRVDGGKAWSSGELKGQPTIMFYVDPDESDVNEHVPDALRAAKVDKSKFMSVAIINMDATWLPNFAIQGKLESKQKEFPDTVYVRDDEKTLVKKWGFKDNSYSIAIFDAEGTCLYSRDGKHDKSATKKVVDLMLQLTGQKAS